MNWQVLGIRHHGPGCARSLVSALEELQPDVLVLEGPSDGEPLIPLAAHPGLKPPVAMLFYPKDAPRLGVYYPLAEFSPEWQALQWALRHQVPVRLMDLPQYHQLAESKSTEDHTAEENDIAGEAIVPERTALQTPRWRTDPIAVLAEAAGYTDHELWWEEQVERRNDAHGLFQGILEAMTAVREEFPEVQPRDLLREAHMRRVLRTVQNDLFSRIAIICGAYHAPVLTEAALARYPAKADTALLQGLPKIAVTASWIPWSHSRLSFRSGYGAGVQSPGWYQQIWDTPATAPTHFIAQAARLLRQSDLDASSASVIESLRLAEALAALRNLRSPGLHEIQEALLAVLCHGQEAPLRLIHEQLEVGDVIGEVPEEVAQVPIARDLEQHQKTLRLKRTTEAKLLDLDLRKQNDLSRSVLFHRLNILGIAWANRQEQTMGTGTFHEFWKLAWKPELAVDLIEASLWGNTIEQAAGQKILHKAENVEAVALLADLLQQARLAELPAAVPRLITCLQSQAAVSGDIHQLMLSIPALTKVVRYSDVRQTDAREVLPILEGILVRVLAGLLPACSSLDEEAARQMVQSMAQVQQALKLLQRDDLLNAWLEKLQRLLELSVHGLVRGWCSRKLLEQGKLSDEAFHRLARLSLSPAREPMDVAAWATGLLQGSGMVLLHHEELWQSLDRWLMELPEVTFTQMLPLLRRAFADFTPRERQAMGEKIKHLRQQLSTPASYNKGVEIHEERAQLVLPVLREILGVK